MPLVLFVSDAFECEAAAKAILDNWWHTKASNWIIDDKWTKKETVSRLILARRFLVAGLVSAYWRRMLFSNRSITFSKASSLKLSSTFSARTILSSPASNGNSNVSIRSWHVSTLNVASVDFKLLLGVLLLIDSLPSVANNSSSNVHTSTPNHMESRSIWIAPTSENSSKPPLWYISIKQSRAPMTSDCVNVIKNRRHSTAVCQGRPFSINAKKKPLDCTKTWP